MQKLPLKPNSKILIKTYAFESGLWYLAKSLGNQLIKEGHQVVYFPKSKYTKEGSRFVRSYPKQKNPKDFERDVIRKVKAEQTVHKQIINAVIQLDIDVIISFETLMQNSSWIKLVKSKTGVKVIDVPMAEWVTPKYLATGVYNVFDSIWTLNKMAEELFISYENAESVTWDFVDRDIFYEGEPHNYNGIFFYHAASLNPNFSTKNTEKVIQAVDRAISKDGLEIDLTLTGNINDYSMLKIIEKHTNIKYINRVLDRKEVADLYRFVDCIIAPSSREGLGLNFYEAAACGCKLITTDAPPMNFHSTPYFCKPDGFKKDGGLIPLADLSIDEIHKQVVKVYEDIKNGR